MKKIFYSLLCVCFLSVVTAFAGCTKPVKGSPDKSNPADVEGEGWTDNY